MSAQPKRSEIPEETVTKWLDEAAEKWPAPWVARNKMGEFTGGMVAPKTMANYDWRGIGPPQTRFGRNVGYWKHPLVDWLKKRILSKR